MQPWQSDANNAEPAKTNLDSTDSLWLQARQAVKPELRLYVHAAFGIMAGDHLDRVLWGSTWKQDCHRNQEILAMTGRFESHTQYRCTRDCVQAARGDSLFREHASTRRGGSVMWSDSRELELGMCSVSVPQDRRPSPPLGSWRACSRRLSNRCGESGGRPEG